MSVGQPTSEWPIGVFDSGIGGLTVVRQLFAQLPDEAIVYFGDSARVPYGSKSPETVTRFSAEATRFLVRRGVKFLVVACNSASAVALETLERGYDVPMLGVIQPGARAAAARTRNGRVGVIGTRATVGSRAYDRALHVLDAKLQVESAACPLFVPFAEEGWLEGEVLEAVARRYLAPLLERGIDTLILGCTHYPILKPALQRVVGDKVELIDTAEETTRQVVQELQSRGLLRPSLAQDRGADPSRSSPPGSAARPRHAFYVSDVPAQFEEVGSRFLGRAIGLPVWVDQNDLPWYERAGAAEPTTPPTKRKKRLA